MLTTSQAFKVPPRDKAHLKGVYASDLIQVTLIGRGNKSVTLRD